MPCSFPFTFQGSGKKGIPEAGPIARLQSHPQKQVTVVQTLRTAKEQKEEKEKKLTATPLPSAAI
jgi:hypothetical protein